MDNTTEERKKIIIKEDNKITWWLDETQTLEALYKIDMELDKQYHSRRTFFYFDDRKH